MLRGGGSDDSRYYRDAAGLRPRRDRERSEATPLAVSPSAYVRDVAEHDYEVSCECGALWRVRLEGDDEAMATCLACGADTFNLTDIGEVHSAGRDVDWAAD